MLAPPRAAVLPSRQGGVPPGPARTSPASQLIVPPRVPVPAGPGGEAHIADPVTRPGRLSAADQAAADEDEAAPDQGDRQVQQIPGCRRPGPFLARRPGPAPRAAGFGAALGQSSARLAQRAQDAQPGEPSSATASGGRTARAASAPRRRVTGPDSLHVGGRRRWGARRRPPRRATRTGRTGRPGGPAPRAATRPMSRPKKNRSASVAAQGRPRRQGAPRASSRQLSETRLGALQRITGPRPAEHRARGPGASAHSRPAAPEAADSFPASRPGYPGASVTIMSRPLQQV